MVSLFISDSIWDDDFRWLFDSNVLAIWQVLLGSTLSSTLDVGLSHWVTATSTYFILHTHIICIQKFVNAYIHACIYTCIYIGMIYSEYMYQCVCNCIHICFWKMRSCHSPNPHGKLVCCLRLCHLPLVQRGAATRTCVKMPRAQTKNSKWYIHFCKARTCDVPYWKRAFLSISSLLTVNFRFRLQQTFRDVRIIKQWIMKYVQIIQTPKLHYASKRLT